MLTKRHTSPPPPRSIKQYLYKTSPKSRAFRFALPLIALAAALLLFVADGFSPPSAQANHIDNEDVPRNLSVTPLRTNVISHTSETIDVLLSWDPPAGFADVGHYRYEYRTWKAVQADGAGWTAKNTAGATTSAEIKGLDPHKRYEFRARTETGGSPNHWSWHTGFLQFGPGGGSVASVAPINHANLNGAQIKVTLESGNNNATFADTGLLVSHFTFPKYHEKFTGHLFSLDGLSVGNIVRDSDTEVTLTLAYSGGRFFTDQYLRVKIDSDALVIASGRPMLPFDLIATSSGVQGKIGHETRYDARPDPPKVTGVRAVPLCEGKYPDSERSAVCNSPIRQEGGKPVGDILEVYWDQVADELEIGGYELQYRPSSSSAWPDDHPIALKVSNKGCRENYEYPGHPESCEAPLHHGIWNLAQGSYDVRVRVFGLHHDRDGTLSRGPWSDTATGVLEPPPARVTTISVTSGPGEGSFTARWQHADRAHSYRVEWTDAESFDPPAFVDTATVLVAENESHLYATSGLINGTAYKLRIISVTEHGTESEPSEVAEFTTLGTPPETQQQQRQPIVDEYDANGDGDISQDEVLAAVNAFYNGDITYEQLEEILAAHDSQSE